MRKKLSYYLFVLGCQMNKSDAERIRFLLNKAGAIETDEKKADVIIVLACSVRQKPIDRIWGKLRNWQKAKKRVFLTGCILPADKKRFAPKVEKLFSIDDIGYLPKWLGLSKKPFLAKDYLEIPPLPLSKDEAFVPIMTGCNNFCTYCAVPYCRGRERSREKKKILDEIKQLIKKGYKKIILLGQNVNSYRCPKTGAGFVQLLKEVVKLPGDFKVEFITPHPKDFSDELIDLIAQSKKIPKKIHLPVQSGDDEILKKMNRNYTVEDYLKLINKLKKKIPNIKISTDIIVGFPGESKKAFENTVRLVKKVGFYKAYIAMYSPRPNTTAFKMFKDDIPQTEKKRRWKILDQLINQ